MIVTVPTVGGGFVTDLKSHELGDGQWSYVQNARMKNGYAGKIDGHVAAPLTAPAEAAYHIASHKVGAKNYWIWSGLANTYADDGTTQTDLTGSAFTGTATDRFTSCSLGGVFIINNGADTPRYWDGNTSNNLAALTGWDANWRCKSLRSFKNYLLALNMTFTATNYPHMVKWSHAAEPGSIPSSWDETDATLDAGERDLAETTDHIVDGLALGDTFIVYKERSMFGLQFVGGNSIFRSFRLPGNFGVLSQNCIAQTPLGHVVLTQGPDLVLHNGNEPQSLLSGRIKRWLSAIYDSSTGAGAFCVANLAMDEVWVGIPIDDTGTSKRCLIWNYRENTFTTRELPSVSAAATGVLDGSIATSWQSLLGNDWDSQTEWWGGGGLTSADQRLVCSSTGNALYLMDQGTRFAGSDFPATLERTGMAFGKPQEVKTIRSIFPRIDGTKGAEVEVFVGAAMDVEGPYTWSEPVTYTIGSSYRADSFASGRFLAVRFKSTANGRWRIRSMDIDYVVRGTY